MNQLSRRLSGMKLPPLSLPIPVTLLWLETRQRSEGHPALHSHSFYEVHFFLAGECVCESEGRRVTVRAGEYLFFPPGSEHILLPEANCRKYSLPFTAGEGEGVSLPARAQREKMTPAMNGCLAVLEEALLREDSTVPFLVRDAVSALLMLLSDGTKRTDADKEPEDLRYPAAYRYLEDHAERNPSSAEIASLLGLSVRQTDRLFRRYGGQSLASAISRARCDAAMKRLVEKGATVRSVSEKLCFSSEYNFIRFFKRMEGISPGRYRAARGGESG